MEYTEPVKPAPGGLETVAAKVTTDLWLVKPTKPVADHVLTSVVNYIKGHAADLLLVKLGTAQSVSQTTQILVTSDWVGNGHRLVVIV